MPLLKQLRQFKSRLHPDHVRLARAAVVVASFTLVAKLFSVGKEIAVAWRYGRGAEVDGYNLALTLSTWLPTTLTSVMAVVLVPILVRLRNADALQRDQFIAELKGLAGWIGGAATLFVLLASASVMP